MSHGEVTVKCLLEIPWHSVTSHLKSFYGEVSFLVYNYFLVVMLFPLNSPWQKSTPQPQSYQRVSSLHMARKTHVKPTHQKPSYIGMNLPTQN